MQFRNLLERSQRYLRAFDWLLAAGSLGWGVYSHNPWWIAGGIIGFALAWYDPGTRIRKHFALVKPGLGLRPQDTPPSPPVQAANPQAPSPRAKRGNVS